MYGFSVVSLTAIPAPRPGDAPVTALRYPAIEQTPEPGEKLKFEPADGQPVQVPGLYLVFGRVKMGEFVNERGQKFSWKRIIGQAFPVSLGDAEKTLAGMVSRLTK